MKENSPCRPDDIHWCLDCCPSSCEKLKKGGSACLNGKRIFNNSLEEPLCHGYNCLTYHKDEEKAAIFQRISELPAGQFKMNDVFLDLKQKVGT